MARLRLDLDPKTYEALMATAVAERRPVGWQAEVILRRTLGLPVPDESGGDLVRERKEVGSAVA